MLKILNDNGLTINGDKCEWKRQELDFFGLHFSKDGVSLKENKVEALMNAKLPENKKEIHSFLGLGTYVLVSFTNMLMMHQYYGA